MQHESFGISKNEKTGEVSLHRFNILGKEDFPMTSNDIELFLGWLTSEEVGGKEYEIRMAELLEKKGYTVIPQLTEPGSNR